MAKTLLNLHFQSPRGEIGRHATLRGWCSQGRASSNLVVGTFKKPFKQLLKWFFVFNIFLFPKNTILL